MQIACAGFKFRLKNVKIRVGINSPGNDCDFGLKLYICTAQNGEIAQLVRAHDS